MPVTRSIKGALQVLQSRRVGRLWIDALCIDQNNKDERGHQILRMKDIYSKAFRTIAWLGPDDEGYAEKAFGLHEAARNPEAESQV